MAQSVISYPKGQPVAQRFWKLLYQLVGWKSKGHYPDQAKSVLIFAPHTSNWDFIFMLMGLYSAGVKLNWMGKKELFFWPVKYFFKALGGIPVDRSKSVSTVKSTLQMFEDRDQIILGLSPEGTRSKIKYWKSGFYHIAMTAGVPINFCYLDYKNKIGGVHEGFMPSGDIKKDMEIVRDFYAEIMPNAKYPHEVGEIKLREKRNTAK